LTIIRNPKRIMSQSLSSVYIHAVFHIKSTSPVIRKQEQEALYAYMGCVLNDLGCPPIMIDGVEDHVHLLCRMSKNIPLSKMIEDVKRHSSRWIKGLDTLHYRHFAWQSGYALFSVSSSLVDKTRRYIANQEEHHRRRTFQEEYMAFLKAYDISFDERYLWND